MAYWACSIIWARHILSQIRGAVTGFCAMLHLLVRRRALIAGGGRSLGTHADPQCLTLPLRHAKLPSMACDRLALPIPESKSMEGTFYVFCDASRR